VVITSDFPDLDLAQFLCQSGLPLIVFADDSATMLDWTRKSRAMGLFDATRYCSRMCSSLAPTLDVASKLVIPVEGSESATRVVTKLINYLWPERGRGFVEVTIEHLLRSEKVIPFFLKNSLAEESQVDDSENLAIGNCLRLIERYADVAGHQPLGDLDWPLELFTRTDHLPWRTPFDLTGPARMLLYGPYLHLPIGNWVARVEFEIDRAVSGVEAGADVRVGEHVFEKNFQMPPKGIFAYNIDFVVFDPNQSIEVRIFMKRGAIEGALFLRSVSVCRR
jgi:hypothetical protein